MNILVTLREVARHSRPYRHRFGLYSGLQLWLSTRRDYKLPKGSLYSLRVPGVKEDIWLRSGTSDIGTLVQVVCNRETEFPLEEQYPTLIIDAGANIGLFSIMIANQYPNCTIVALEVESKNFEMLRRNTKKYPNIVPVQKALWRSTGHVRIVDTTVAANAFAVVTAESSESGAIRSTSIDDLVRELGLSKLDLLKMDIEGSELEILEDDSAQWPTWTNALLVELHDRFRPGCTAALNRLVVRLHGAVTRHGEYHLAKFRQ